MAASDKPSNQKRSIDVLSGNAKTTGGDQAFVTSWAAPVTDNGLGDLARGLGQFAGGAQRVAGAFIQRRKEQEEADVRLSVATALTATSDQARDEYAKYKDENQDPNTFPDGVKSKVVDPLIQEGRRVLEERYKDNPTLLKKARTAYGLAAARMYDSYSADAQAHSNRLFQADFLNRMGDMDAAIAKASASGDITTMFALMTEKGAILEELPVSRLSPEKIAQYKQSVYTEASAQITTAAVENFRSSLATARDTPGVDVLTVAEQKKKQLFELIDESAALFKNGPTAISSLKNNLEQQFNAIQRAQDTIYKKEADATYSDIVSTFQYGDTANLKQLTQSAQTHADQYDQEKLTTIYLAQTLAPQTENLRSIVLADPTGQSPEIRAQLMRWDKGEGVMPDGSDVPPEMMAEYRKLVSPKIAAIRAEWGSDKIGSYMFNGLSIEDAKKQAIGDGLNAGQSISQLSQNLFTPAEVDNILGEITSAGAGLPKIKADGTVTSGGQVAGVIDAVGAAIKTAQASSPQGLPAKQMALFRLYEKGTAAQKRLISTAAFFLPNADSTAVSKQDELLVLAAHTPPEGLSVAASNYGNSVTAEISGNELWQKLKVAKVNGAGAEVFSLGMLGDAERALKNYTLVQLSRRGVDPKNGGEIRSATKEIIDGVMKRALRTPEGLALTKSGSPAILGKNAKIDIGNVMLPEGKLTNDELRDAAMFIQNDQVILEQFGFTALSGTEQPDNFRFVTADSGVGVRVQVLDKNNDPAQVYDRETGSPLIVPWEQLKEYARQERALRTRNRPPEAQALVDQYRALTPEEARSEKGQDLLRRAREIMISGS